MCSNRIEMVTQIRGDDHSRAAEATSATIGLRLLPVAIEGIRGMSHHRVGVIAVPIFLNGITVDISFPARVIQRLLQRLSRHTRLRHARVWWEWRRHHSHQASRVERGQMLPVRRARHRRNVRSRHVVVRLRRDGSHQRRQSECRDRRRRARREWIRILHLALAYINTLLIIIETPRFFMALEWDFSKAGCGGYTT
ncbi:hypothetical protein SASPL_144838 [Salvia splendens]|uniref:Uncharacterized protein n=1 Tax=Salvia splendens TaxID=180675 RepID=A0A8X8WGG8_SALSN|nr:hypothetical protein SASPL_144838 [Salvia splendens]